MCGALETIVDGEVASGHVDEGTRDEEGGEFAVGSGVEMDGSFTDFIYTADAGADAYALEKILDVVFSIESTVMRFLHTVRSRSFCSFGSHLASSRAC
jgi:hypothetical protein